VPSLHAPAGALKAAFSPRRPWGDRAPASRDSPGTGSRPPGLQSRRHPRVERPRRDPCPRSRSPRAAENPPRKLGRQPTHDRRARSRCEGRVKTIDIETQIGVPLPHPLADLSRRLHRPHFLNPIRIQNLKPVAFVVVGSDTDLDRVRDVDQALAQGVTEHIAVPKFRLVRLLVVRSQGTPKTTTSARSKSRVERRRIKLSAPE
jgi:hypothetical protein